MTSLLATSLLRRQYIDVRLWLAVTSAVHNTAPAALHCWCHQSVRVTTTATKFGKKWTHVIRLNCITAQSVTDKQHCCHQHLHFAASGVSPQPQESTLTASQVYRPTSPRWCRHASSSWDICIRFGVCSVTMSLSTSWQCVCRRDWTMAMLW